MQVFQDSRADCEMSRKVEKHDKKHDKKLDKKRGGDKYCGEINIWAYFGILCQMMTSIYRLYILLPRGGLGLATGVRGLEPLVYEALSHTSVQGLIRYTRYLELRRDLHRATRL